MSRGNPTIQVRLPLSEIVEMMALAEKKGLAGGVAELVRPYIRKGFQEDKLAAQAIALAQAAPKLFG